MDILTVYHHTQHHGIALLLDEVSDLFFLLEGISAGQVVVQGCFRGLYADLNVIQSGFPECPDFVLIQVVARGDEVDIITQPPGMADQFTEIRACQRFSP